MRKEARKHSEKLEEQRAIIEALIEENKRLDDEGIKDNLNGGKEVRERKAKIDPLEDANRKLLTVMGSISSKT